MAFCFMKRVILTKTVKVFQPNRIIAGVQHLQFNFESTRKAHNIISNPAQFNESELKFGGLILKKSPSSATTTQSKLPNLIAVRELSSKKSSKYEHDYDSDSDSDNEAERQIRKGVKKGQKVVQRGNSEFWRRKMRTLHGILDINNDGVISFDDFMLLARKFTDLGHLTPASEEEFLAVIKKSWEEQYGEIDPYNLVTAEAYLTDMHHMLNDKELVKKIGQFLPYFFKAVDTDHSGYLDLEQFKLFFNCLGLSDENAAVSFAVIDKNGDGKLSQKEFVKLGRDFFLTEDERRVSKMFWGPLVDH